MDEAGRIPAPAPTLLHMSVELIHQGRHRQARAVGLRLFEADTQILAHPVDGEAEFELAVEHGAAAILHLPALRRPLGDHIENLVRSEEHTSELQSLMRIPYAVLCVK